MPSRLHAVAPGAPLRFGAVMSCVVVSWSAILLECRCVLGGVYSHLLFVKMEKERVKRKEEGKEEGAVVRGALAISCT